MRMHQSKILVLGSPLLTCLSPMTCTNPSSFPANLTWGDINSMFCSLVHLFHFTSPQAEERRQKSPSAGKEGKLDRKLEMTALSQLSRNLNGPGQAHRPSEVHTFSMSEEDIPPLPNAQEC